MLVSDVPDLRRCIVAEAGPHETRAVERLLGQLATIESAPRDRARRALEFTPSPGTAALAARAVERLRIGWRRVPRRRAPVAAGEADR